MHIRYSETFQQSFRLLSALDRRAVLATLELFEADPLHESLRNHALKAPLLGRRSLSVRDDLRILFREKGGYVEVTMLKVGTHEDVY